MASVGSSTLHALDETVMTRQTISTDGLRKMARKLGADFCSTVWSVSGRSPMPNGSDVSMSAPSTKNGIEKSPSEYSAPPITGPTENPRPTNVSKIPYLRKQTDFDLFRFGHD